MDLLGTRVFLGTIAVAALVWCAVPEYGMGSTDLAIVDPANDPNTYSGSYRLGMPRPWLTYIYNWKIKDGIHRYYNYRTIVDGTGMLIHASAVLIPVVLLVFSFRNAGRRKKSKGVD